MIPFFNKFGPAAMLVVAVGCQRHEITYYEVPAEPREPAAAVDHSGHNHPPAAAQAPAIRWEAPEGWTDAGEHPVRVGNFTIADDEGATAEVSVLEFPEDSGSVADFVNFAARELELPAVDEETATGLVNAFPAGDRSFDVFALEAGSGEPGDQALRVALLREAGRTWYFKMSGDAALVADQDFAFLEFLESVEFEAPAEAAPTMPPATGDMASQGLPAGAMATADNPDWTVPAHWEAGRPSSMRRGSFAVTGGSGGSLDISVTAFPGDVGGTLANINRWRRQIGLPPTSAEELAGEVELVPVGVDTGQLVDLTGPRERTLAVTVSQGGDSWFFKVTGPPGLVEQERSAFLEFVESVRF